MALNYVSLVCNYLDGQGYPVTSGTVTFTPNVVVTDTTDNVIITQAPVTVNLRLTPSPTMVLLATDNSGLTPSGWAWMIQPLFPGAPPGQLFLLPHSGGATQYLADLMPAVAAPDVSTAYLPTAGGTVTGPAVFTGGLAIPTGAGSGDVLTSDSSGNAAWAAAGSSLSLTPTAVKTTAYTASAADYVPVDTTAGNVTITLPAAPANRALVGVKQVIQGGSNTVTITCGAAVFNKAGGGTTLTLPLLNQGVLLQYASGPGIWYVLADDLGLSTLDTRYSTPAALTAAVGVETTRAETAEALALPLAGGTMTGAITLPGNPSSALQSAPKQYVDAVASGLAVKPSVQEATTAALPANTYSGGVLTATGNGVLTVDGVTVALGDRILVQNETATANNGIYTVTTLGTSGVPYALTRAADMNTGGQVPGAFTFCEQGTVNAGAGFTVAGTGPYTLGTTGIPWTQFSGAGEVTAGTGLGKTGNTVSLTVPVAVTSGGTGATSAGAALTSLGAAPLASPALTGTPTAPTPAALTASTVLATTAYADTATGVETSRATTAEALLAPLAAKNTFSMDQYFKSGKPWFDVCAYGADPAGVADSTVAFQAAINAACNLRTDTNVGFTATSTTVTDPAAVSGDVGKYLTSQNFPRIDTSCGTNSTTTVTDAWAQYSDLGCTITGTGIPAATTITAVSNGVGYTISNAATATASGLTFTVIGGSGGYAHITGLTSSPTGYTVNLAATATLSAQTAAVGTSATLSGRNAVGPVYIPAGLYLISSDLLIRSVLGFRMQGAGADQVRLAPVGTGFTQAVIFIDGSLDGVFEGFNIQGNGTEGAAGSTNPGILHAIRLDWTKAASRSTSANHFRNIRIRATNFVTGLSAEGTLARQVDGTYLHDVLVTGLQTAGSWSSAGNWQAGFAFGNGTQGNIYDHVAVACGASNCYYNFKVNCSSIALFGAQPGANGIDYYLQNPTSQCTVENVQSQNSGQLIVCAGNASIVPVSFRDIQYKPYVGRADTGLCGTNSTTTVTDTAAVAGDLNKPICGPGIPLGATITFVTPSTGYTISAAATATASGLTFTVGFNPTWISTGTSYGSWVLENVAYTPAGTVATPPIISLGAGHGSYGQQFTLIGVSQPAPPSTGITTGTSVPVIAIAYSDISAGQGPGLTATYPFYARNSGVMFQQGLAASRPAVATYGEMWYWATDTNVLSHSNGTAWTTVNVATSGTASGDLSGSYPGPTVAKLNGVTISNAPATGQALLATGTTAASWQTFSAGVTIDTTSADIQPPGTRSYGNPATGLAADSGHVHPLPTAPDIQVFSANGTWNKVAGVQTVQLMMIGSGGGGGGGHRGATSNTTASCGGGGGGGGGLLIRQFAAADLPTSVTVTVGAGGASGAAATSDASNGGNGGGGGYTYFVGYASLIGGGAANGGTTAAGAAGAVGPGSSVGGIGAAASTTGGAGLGGQPGAGGGGGGSGGGLVITTPVATLGGAGGYSWSAWNSNVGVVGAVDSTSPTAGTLPTVKGNPSCGGAGGCSSITTVAQNGATAYIGGGGGGGGASVSGNNSGAGGVGGPGYVMVISYFQ